MIQTIGRFIFLILVIFAADQLSKFYVINLYNIDVSNLSSQYLTSINKYLNFHLIWNKGFAFGILQNEISMVNYIYMFVMAIIAIAVFFYAISINNINLPMVCIIYKALLDIYRKHCLLN